MSVIETSSYDEQRMRWRKSLPEGIVRQLASDYLRGMKDECTYDAYQEYLQRFGHESRSPLSSGWQRKHNRSAR